MLRSYALSALLFLGLLGASEAQVQLSVQGPIVANHCTKFVNSRTIADAGANCGTGSSPADATYITQTANGSLSAEQALGSLATGLVKNTTTSGVLSIVVPAAGIETWLATPSSANLLAALTDETGTGAAVFATSPTLVTPALGTPASGVLTNATGLPAAGVVGTAAILGANSFTTTQTITPATEVSPLVLTGGTLAGTTSRPLISGTQTWNNSGLTATGLLFNFTDTSSNAASKLIDLQLGGTTKFAVSKAGVVNLFGYTASDVLFKSDVTQAATLTLLRGDSGDYGLLAAKGISVIGSSVTGGVRLASDALVNWTNNTAHPSGGTGTNDTFIRRDAAANIAFGSTDAASPVAQTLSVQDVVAGTSNTAGANFTIKGSAGTGTGAGGSIIFQTAPAHGSDSVQGTQTTALTIDSTAKASFTGNVFAPNVQGLGGSLLSANFNSTADQAITILLPPGVTRYKINNIFVSNPSVSLTTAAGGFYTATSKGGTAIVAASQAYSTLTTNAANTAGSLLNVSVAVSTAFWTATPIYLSLTTAQGSAATADVHVFVQYLP